MNRLLFFFIAFFSLSVCDKTLCASSEWLDQICKRIIAENQGKRYYNSIVEGVDIRPLPDYSHISYYKKANEKADYSKQRLRMAVNTQEYDLNEPIYVRFFLKNMSNDDLIYYMAQGSLGFDTHLSLQIIYEDGSSIEKIQKDTNIFPMKLSGNIYVFSTRCYNYLCAGREIEISRLQDTTLEQIYSLTRPGKYRVTALFSIYNGEIEAEPVEFVIRDRQFELPLEPPRFIDTYGGRQELPSRQIERRYLWNYAKDQWGNPFFYTTKFRLAFDPSKDQHCFNPDEPIDLLLYTFDNERWLRRFPWPVDEKFPPPQMNNVPLFALDKIPYRGVRLVLLTPEGRRVSKVLSSPGDAPDTCAELDEGILDLRKVFDLTTPGKYRLSGDLRSVRPGQQFVPPLDANEIEFEIQ